MSEKAPLFDPEAAAGYGATPTTSWDRRRRGMMAKMRNLQRQKSRQTEAIGSPAEHTPLCSMLRRHSHRWYANTYRWILRLLVFTTVVNFVLESEVYFKKCCTAYFNDFEGFVSVTFLVEYFLKIHVSPQRGAFKHSENPQMEYILSGESLIDIASFLPYFVELALGIPQTKYEVLQLLGLIRLWKLPFFWESFRMVARVVYFNARILLSSFYVCFLMLMGCSILLYYTRPVPPDPYENFTSILSCFYLSILMLTGQGIPDGILPWYTRVVVAVTAIFAIAQFAIPASMLTWGFEQEAERNIKKHVDREKKVMERIRKGKSIPESSSSSGESDREEEWDGYVEQVKGSESESGASEDGSRDVQDEQSDQKLSAAAQRLLQRSSRHSLSADEMRRAKRVFEKLDTDSAGNINTAKVRVITDSDEEASHLFESMTAVSEGDDVDMHDFITWLSDVKRQYHKRYGDKIFLTLLHQMEEKLAKDQSSWQRAKEKIKLLNKARLKAKRPFKVATGAGVEGQKPQMLSSHQQLVKYAERFGEMERSNKEMQEKAAKLEAEIERLKRAKES